MKKPSEILSIYGNLIQSMKDRFFKIFESYHQILESYRVQPERNNLPTNLDY